MPKISVILPVYNVEKYIREALDSVVNQTLKDIEIICIDDCSTDNSYEILQEYASKDDRFIVLKQETNQGQGAARNRGLDIAKGEYIMFLDPDDWYEHDACELCYHKLKNNNNDILVFAHNKYVEKTKETKYIDDMVAPFVQYQNDDSSVTLSNVKSNFVTIMYTVCFAYKNSFLTTNNIRFPNYRNFEDQVFYAKAMLNAKSLSIIEKALYTYRIRETSSTFLYTNQHNDIYNAKKYIIESLNNSNINQNLKRAFYVHTINSTIYWYNKLIKICSHKQKLYDNIRKIFLYMDKEYIDMNIKSKIKYKNYRKYVNFTKYNYFNIKIYEMLQNIFSMENYEDSKIITIFGIKIIKNRYITPFYIGLLSFLFSWMFPTREDRQKFRDLCNEIDERKSILKIQKNYKNIIKRIKNKKGKIRVLFLVSENSKWKAQSLYDLMAESEDFEPIIALSVLNIVHIGKDKTRNEIKYNYEYFKSKGMNVVFAYKNNKFIDLKNFKPDIVFYEQPWELPSKHQPKKVGKFALLHYIPYYVNTYGVYDIDYDKSFHKYMFRHYVLNKNWEEEYKKLAKRDNIYGLGHTILDNFYLNKNNVSDKNYVIYAPHFSFPHELNENPVNYGTFLDNGYKILEYAKAHPELNWVFKPHPQLKFVLLKIGESIEKVEQYYKDWEALGKACYDSSYIDLFLNSKALITDCSSFLTEYFCTGKPLIHLISDECKIIPNKIAKKIFNTFYQVHNLDEMYKTFDKVLVQNIDDKKEERLKVLEETGMLNNYAAKNIMDDIINVLS